MALFIVSYDLMSPGQDYSKIQQAIKATGTCARLLESTWLVQSNLGAAQIRDTVQRSTDPNDRILVVRVGTDWATLATGQLATSWLKSLA